MARQAIRRLGMVYMVVVMAAGAHWVVWSNHYTAAQQFPHAVSQVENLWDVPTWTPTAP